MAVKMRLRREGKKKQPFYRVVVADVRSPRDGRFIEDIGYYHPLSDPSTISIDHERALYWLRNGVQPSSAVVNLLRIEGIWEEFKPGEPDPSAQRREVRAAKREKKAEHLTQVQRRHEERAAEVAEAKAAADAAAVAAAQEPAVDDSPAEAAPEVESPEPKAGAEPEAEAPAEPEAEAPAEPAAEASAEPEAEGPEEPEAAPAEATAENADAPAEADSADEAEASKREGSK